TETGGSDTATPTSEKYGGRLVAGWNTGEIQNLSPTWITIGINAQIMANAFNALVQTTPKLEIVPDLAKDWTVEDKTTFVFNLREGVKFHNGTEFTAQDVYYTIEQIFKQNSPVKPKMAPLKQYDQGGVRVIDDYTVELNFDKPYGPALPVLARGDGRGSTIINKQAVEKMGWKQYKVKPVGTGPFKIVEHNVGSKVTLDKFDDYFQGYWAEQEGAELPYLDGIDIKPLPKASTRVNAIKGGDLDFLNLVPVQNLQSLQKNENVSIKSGPGGGYTGLVLNGDKDKFTDPKVRLGIAKLVDQKSFVKQAFFGKQHVAEGPIAPAHGWAFREDKPDFQAYNPEKGKQMLKEAGMWPMSFSIMASPSNIRQARVMRQLLIDDGLEVEVEQVPSASYDKRLRNWDYETAISGNAVDLDPDAALYLFFLPRDMGGSINFWGYKPLKNGIKAAEKLPELLQKQRETVDRDKRRQIFHKIEDILIKDAGFAFTHHYKPWVAYTSNVKGYKPHPINRDFHTVWLDQ
ncbi:MAG: ABC transporter substrate-binding protein, partial [Halobacteriaceae archaeon]